jgi:hypothetical protein
MFGDDGTDPYQTGIDAGTTTPVTTANTPAQPSGSSGSFDIGGILQQVGQGVQSYEQAQFTTQWLQLGLAAFAIWAITRPRKS